MNRPNTSACLVLVMFLAAEGLALAQAAGTATGGVIWGTVKDDTGTPVPGVTLSAQGPAVMGTPTVLTNQEGIYRFPSLPPGEYKVTFSLAGFSTVIREGLRISAGFTATVDETLKLATLEETVQVVGASPVIDSVNTRLQTTFSADRIASLPLTREIWSILAASPAIQMSRIDVGGSTAGTQTGYRSYGISSQASYPARTGIIRTTTSTRTAAGISSSIASGGSARIVARTSAIASPTFRRRRRRQSSTPIRGRSLTSCHITTSSWRTRCGRSRPSRTASTVCCSGVPLSIPTRTRRGTSGQQGGSGKWSGTKRSGATCLPRRGSVRGAKTGPRGAIPMNLVAKTSRLVWLPAATTTSIRHNGVRK